MSKSKLAEEMIKWAEANGIPVFHHSPNNINGRKETVIVDELPKLASIDDIVNGRAKLGINPDAKPLNMTPEDAAKLDWVAIGDPRPRHR